MKRTGFTLVETVLALALLGVLTLATVSWTVATLRLRTGTLADGESARAIQTFARLLAIDLVSDDLHGLSAARREHRVWVDRGTLHILTRDSGLGEATYTFESGRVTRRLRPLIGHGHLDSVVVLDDLEAFDVTVDVDERRDWGEVVVLIRPADARVTRLGFPVPAEWLR